MIVEGALDPAALSPSLYPLAWPPLPVLPVLALLCAAAAAFAAPAAPGPAPEAPPGYAGARPSADSGARWRTGRSTPALPAIHCLARPGQVLMSGYGSVKADSRRAYSSWKPSGSP